MTQPNGRRFHSLTTEYDRLDPDTRRRVPLDQPRVILTTTTASGRAQTIELTPADLARLLRQTAAVAADALDGGRRRR